MRAPPQALAGKRVVVTQAAHQAAELANLLQARGAYPLLYPCIAIEPPEDSGELDHLLNCAAQGGFDWLVLTSANTVLMIERRLCALRLDPSRLGGVSVAAIGPATTEAVQLLLGLEVTVVPEEHVAEGLAAALLDKLPPGARVLVPQSAIARSVLVDQLRAHGAAVVAVSAYRTVIGAGGVELASLLSTGDIDAITFTSSSTVRNLVSRLKDEGGAVAQLGNICLACIGAVTARTAAEMGLSATVVSPKQSIESLVDALESYYELSHRKELL